MIDKTLKRRLNKSIKLIVSSLKSHCDEPITDFDVECIKEYTYTLETLLRVRKELGKI